MTNTPRTISGVRFGTILAAILVVLVLLFTELDLAVQMLFGWTSFLAQVLPKVHVRWDGVIVFGVGVAILICIAHYLLAWIVRERNARRSDEAPIVWRFRSSIGLVFLSLLVFVVGIAMTGITHQVAWLATEPTPLYVDRVQSSADSEQSVYRPGTVAETLGTSWIMEVLPYLPFFQPDVDRSLAWNSPRNAPGFKKLVPMTICPSQGNPLWSPDGFGLSQVATNEELFAAGKQSGSRNQVIGSHVFLLGETNAGFVPWGDPRSGRSASLGLRRNWTGVPRGQVGFGSVHPSGANICLGDLSVRFVSNGTDPRVLEQLNQPK
ncbi:MAG: H-X9-DG-CTERM domain-containing protein [Pirellulales bacterium]